MWVEQLSQLPLEIHKELNVYFVYINLCNLDKLIFILIESHLHLFILIDIISKTRFQIFTYQSKFILKIDELPTKSLCSLFYIQMFNVLNFFNENSYFKY